ncbi:ATP-binding cassette domain-containing protein [Sphingomonas sp.]|uniref:ATP-binding cassette domain-containing protein n=1 Tax=Sphingomonas sp. TaxID=28214 RepID=UPI0035BBB589
MSFDVDVTLRRGNAEVCVAFAGGDGATVLFGPSGIGKTSVLDMVAGLLKPDRGHIRVGGVTLFGEGVNVPPDRRAVGYVFQEARLFPHLKVRANLLYGARSDERLQATADMLDIAHLLDRWPRTLSGGEARRVAIGRALLSDARFLLLDEPLASLDRARREEAMRAIERVRDEAGLPILMVTHDPEEAERIGTRVVRM